MSVLETDVMYNSERRLLCSPRMHLFYKKYSKNSNIMEYYSNFEKTVFHFNIWNYILNITIYWKYIEI